MSAPVKTVCPEADTTRCGVGGLDSQVRKPIRTSTKKPLSETSAASCTHPLDTTGGRRTAGRIDVDTGLLGEAGARTREATTDRSDRGRRGVSRAGQVQSPHPGELQRDRGPSAVVA